MTGGRGEALLHLLRWPKEYALLRVGGMLTTPSRGRVRGDGSFLIPKTDNSWCIMFLKALMKIKIFDSFVA